MQSDNIAGTICRVVNCKRKRERDTIYCADDLRRAWFKSLPLKVRIRR